MSRMCQVLKVSRSGYYAWRGRPPSEREMANQALYKEIKAVYDESHGTYGSPRIYQALRRRGFTCSENRVARLMRLKGLQAEQAKSYKSTTKRNKADAVAPNVLQRDFEATRPDEKWLADITQIPTEEGWLYLAAILDLYSRRIVGWAMSDRMTDDLTLSALRMAVEQRELGLNLIHHSDQGSQYTAEEYLQLLKDWRIEVRMNVACTLYDNAMMESFFGTLKTELDEPLPGHAAARLALFEYIEVFYNRQRLHSALGYQSPATCEQQHQVA